MRWKGIIVFAVLLVLIIGFWILFIDGIIKSSIESIGSSMNGAKVEIDKLSFGLFGPSIDISGLQVADPANEWQNQLAAKSIRFKMEFAPLLSGKVIIDEMSAEGVQQGGKRNTSGKIALPTRPATTTDQTGLLSDLSASVKQETANSPIAQALASKEKMDFSQLLMPDKLTSLAEINKLNLELDKHISATKTALDNLNAAQRLDAIKKQISEIDFKEKNPLKLAKEAKKAKELLSELKKLSDGLKQTESQAKSGLDFALDAPKRIDSLKEKDYQTIITSIGEIKGLDKSSIGKFLFGPNCLADAQIWLGRLKKMSQFLKKTPEQKAQAKALKGTDIEFPKEKQYPVFLIKKIYFSSDQGISQSSDNVYEGTVKDICSDPKFYGQPTTLSITATTGLAVSGIFDYTKEPGHDHLTIKTSQNAQTLSSFLPNGPAQIETNIDYQDNTTEIAIQYSQSEWAPDNGASTKNELSTAITNAIRNSKEINITAEITLGTGKTAFKIHSNLDDSIANAIKALADSKLSGAKQEVKHKIDQMVEPQQAELLKKIDATKTEQEKQLSGQNKEVTDLSNTLESKVKGIGK